MRILLGSGGFRSEERRHNLATAMQHHFGDIREILFIPYAKADHDRYLRVMIERGLPGRSTFRGIHTCEDPRQAVATAEAIYIGGGNTFRLLKDLYAHDLLSVIRERVISGVPYMGVSAGSNVACPTMMTTNDMPIVHPPSLDALNLVSFQLNTHYFAGQTHVKGETGFHEHFGETRDIRVGEYHELNDSVVIGLWEGGFVRVADGKTGLTAAPARIFRRGNEPVDVEPPASLNPYL